MIDFYKTIMGHTFYEGTMPRLVRAIEKVATIMERVEKRHEHECPVCGHRPRKEEHEHNVQAKSEGGAGGSPPR